jgi:hypothetical protein
MFLDFKLNGVNVIADYFRSMETESMKKLSNMGQEINYSQYNSFDRQSSIKQDVTSITQMKLDSKENSLISDINIKGEDRDTIAIDYKVTVYAEKLEQAQKLAEKLEIDKNIEDQTILFKFEFDDNQESIKMVKVNYEIKVPQDLKLDIVNYKGKLQVGNINSDIKLSNSYAPTIVNNINGKVDIKARFGDLELERVTGETVIENSFNKTFINNVDNNVILKSSYGAIDIENISGDLNLDTKFGGVNLLNINGDLTLDSQYSGCFVKTVKGKISAEVKFGEMEFEDVNNDFIFTGKHSDLKVKLNPNFKDYSIYCYNKYENIRSNINIPVISDGNVKEMKGTIGKGTYNIKISSEHGDIFINQ